MLPSLPEPIPEKQGQLPVQMECTMQGGLLRYTSQAMLLKMANNYVNNNCQRVCVCLCMRNKSQMMTDAATIYQNVRQSTGPTKTGHYNVSMSLKNWKDFFFIPFQSSSHQTTKNFFSHRSLLSIFFKNKKEITKSNANNNIFWTLYLSIVSINHERVYFITTIEKLNTTKLASFLGNYYFCLFKNMKNIFHIYYIFDVKRMCVYVGFFFF